MTTTLKQDAKLADFAVLAYTPGGKPVPKGWEQIGISEVESFAAYAYFNAETKEIVIAHRGTDDLGDWAGANQDILRGHWTPQLSQAVEFADKIRKSEEAKGATIHVTGHSLGGAQAQVISQMFGLDGMTLDPLAAEKIIHTPEFRKHALELTQNPNGLGMPESFVNYGVTDSVVSNATGKQLGRMLPVPGMDLPGKELGKAVAVAAALHPAAGMVSLIASDQVGSKHSSIPGSQTIRMLAAAAEQDALNNGNLFAGQIHFEQVTQRVPGPLNQETVQKVSNEMLLKNAQGETMALLRFSGGIDNRQLDIYSPDGKQRLYQIQDPAGPARSAPSLHEAAKGASQQDAFGLTAANDLTAAQREIVLARIQENIRSSLTQGDHLSVNFRETIEVRDVPDRQLSMG